VITDSRSETFPESKGSTGEPPSGGPEGALPGQGCDDQGMTPEIPAVVVADVDDALLAEAFVLDVREPDEWARGHIENAVHIPLGQLQERVGEVPLGQKVLCVCAVGGRSSMATQFLASQGRDAINLDGGMTAWEGAGKPVSFD
jgi:rhodanese-related sulfurtransferase